MADIKPYIIFNGQCEEALQFYADCLGGKITLLQRFSDAPFEAPAGAEELIYNSEMVAGDICIKASDSMPSHSVEPGSSYALFLSLDTEDDLQQTYDRLAENGTVMFPLNNGFAMLSDRYGTRWMLTVKQ